LGLTRNGGPTGEPVRAGCSDRCGGIACGSAHRSQVERNRGLRSSGHDRCACAPSSEATDRPGRTCWSSISPDQPPFSHLETSLTSLSLPIVFPNLGRCPRPPSGYSTNTKRCPLAAPLLRRLPIFVCSSDPTPSKFCWPTSIVWKFPQKEPKPSRRIPSNTSICVHPIKSGAGTSLPFPNATARSIASMRSAHRSAVVCLMPLIVWSCLRSKLSSPPTQSDELTSQARPPLERIHRHTGKRAAHRASLCRKVSICQPKLAAPRTQTRPAPLTYGMKPAVHGRRSPPPLVQHRRIESPETAWAGSGRALT
jgi:hypothetical protein